MQKIKLPIRVNIHWAMKLFSIFFIAKFMRSAWLSWNNNGELLVALSYVLMVLMCVMLLVFTLSTLDVDETAIYVNESIGLFLIYWDEVIGVETNGLFYVFHGENKSLAINVLMAGKGKQEFQKYVGNRIVERNILVKSLPFLKWFTYMNTSAKVK